MPLLPVGNGGLETTLYNDILIDEANITTLQGTVVSLQNQINTLSSLDTAGLATLQTSITANVSGITANTTDITTIKAEIVTLNGDVTTIDASLATLSTNVGTYTASIATLNSEVTTINSDISSIDTSLTTLSGNIATHTSAITTLNSEISTIDSSLTTLSTNIATNASAITTLNSTVSGHTTSIATNSTAITTLNGEVATNISNITTLNSEVAGNTTNITTNTNSISTLNSTVSGHTTSIATHSTAITTLNGEVATNTYDITTLNGEVATHSLNIALDQTNIGILTSDITTINSNVTSANTAIATNATNIATLNTEISVLDSEVSNVCDYLNLGTVSVGYSGAYLSDNYYNKTGTNSQISSAITTNNASYPSLTYLSSNNYTQAQINTMLNSYLQTSLLNVANGLPTLDSSGKVKISQLPYGNLLSYKGVWNGTTPSLANGTGSTGDVWISGFGGTYNFGAGSQTIYLNDWIVYNGTVYDVNEGNDQVSSIFGRTGAITAQSGDYSSFYYIKSQIDGFLATYSTTTLMNSAISSALASYYTSTISDGKYQLQSAMSAYSNTTSMNSAIASALTAYYTSTVSDGKYQLQSAMSTYSNTTSMNMAIASALTAYYSSTVSDSRYQLQSAMSAYSNTTSMNSSIASALTSYYTSTVSDGKYALITSDNNKVSISGTIGIGGLLAYSSGTNSTIGTMTSTNYNLISSSYLNSALSNYVLSSALTTSLSSYYTSSVSDGKYALITSDNNKISLSGSNAIAGLLAYTSGINATIGTMTTTNYNLVTSSYLNNILTSTYYTGANCDSYYLQYGGNMTGSSITGGLKYSSSITNANIAGATSTMLVNRSYTDATYAIIASPTFTGTVTIPTLSVSGTSSLGATTMTGNSTAIVTSGQQFVIGSSSSAGIFMTNVGFGSHTSATSSEISNETLSYQALMILGNTSAGYERRVRIYDNCWIGQNLFVNSGSINGASLIIAGTSTFGATNITQFAVNANVVNSTAVNYTTATGNNINTNFLTVNTALSISAYYFNIPTIKYWSLGSVLTITPANRTANAINYNIATTSTANPFSTVMAFLQPNRELSCVPISSSNSYPAVYFFCVSGVTSGTNCSMKMGFGTRGSFDNATANFSTNAKYYWSGNTMASNNFTFNFGVEPTTTNLVMSGGANNGTNSATTSATIVSGTQYNYYCGFYWSGASTVNVYYWITTTAGVNIGFQGNFLQSNGSYAGISAVNTQCLYPYLSLYNDGSLSSFTINTAISPATLFASIPPALYSVLYGVNMINVFDE